MQSKNVVLVSCLVKEYHSTMLNIIKLVQDQGLFRSTHDFCLEHTKPLFKDHKLLTIHSSYYKHIFIKMFKILKFREPRGLFEKVLIRSNNRNNRMVLNPIIKNNKLPATEQNFLFKSCKIWNTFAKEIFEKNRININQRVYHPW